MNLLATTHQALLSYYDLSEWKMRTGKDSLDAVWLKSLESEIKKMPPTTIHKDEMLSRVKELRSNEKIANQAIKDFYQTHPHLEARYDHDFERVYLHREELIEFKVPINLANKQYMISALSSIELEKREYDELNTIQRLSTITKELQSGKLFYQLELEEKEIPTNTKRIIGVFSNKAPFNETHKEAFLIHNLNDLVETDLEVMDDFLSKNPAFNFYKKQRDIIPQILTRCENNNLMEPVTNEAVKIFQNIITQEKIYGMKVSSKMPIAIKNKLN